MDDSNNTKSQLSWTIVIIAILFFWPIGVYLLYRKISANIGDQTFRSSKNLTVIGGIIFSIGFIYFMAGITGNLQEEEGTSVVFGVIAMLILFCGSGSFIIYIARKIKRNVIKYNKYITIIVNNGKTSIDSIAAAMSSSYEEVTKDLQKMIAKGYFEDAYIDAAGRRIVLGGQIRYQDSGNAYRFKVVSCENCGADNKLLEGQIGKCEYCGSIIE